MEDNNMEEIAEQPSLDLGDLEVPAVKESEEMATAKLESTEKETKEAKPKKPTKSKIKNDEDEIKEECYTGVITYCNGLQQSPMNLDAIFAKDDNYQKNQGATKDMIKSIASKAIMELQNPGTDIEIINDPKIGNCFFLKNNLSKKGAVEYDCIPLVDIEVYFDALYQTERTEARALVYYNLLSEKFIVDYPSYIEKSAISTTNAVSYCLNNDVNKYLVCDFHSHHVMNNDFSATDDIDETGKARIIFGCFSFNDLWNFRFWNNKTEKFTYLAAGDKPEDILKWLKIIK